MRKRFDSELFKKNDQLAKNRLKEILGETYPYKALENTKRYGVDLLILDEMNTHICNVEVEIKRVWKGDFPYDSVNIPERKAKYTKLEKKHHICNV